MDIWTAARWILIFIGAIILGSILKSGVPVGLATLAFPAWYVWLCWRQPITDNGHRRLGVVLYDCMRGKPGG